MREHSQKTMTRRSRPLDLHALAKTNFEGLRPLPEKPEDPDPLSQLTQLQHQDSVSSYSSEESERLSYSSSSPPTGRSGFGFFNESVSSSIGTGGNITTGRISAYSWDVEDEFDKKASTQVRSMFDEIDDCLFENVEHLSISECSDWNTSFPYIRILGSQLLQIDETGTKMIPTTTGDDSQHHNQSILEDVEADQSENSSLSVNGHKVEAATAPTRKLSPTSRSDDSEPTSSHNLSYLEEEVFAMDGDIEEFIAFDDNTSEVMTSREKHTQKKKHGAFPSVTPHLFVHETIISECFDYVWTQIIGILKNLLKLYIKMKARKVLEMQHANFDSNMDRFLESSLELLPQSRDSNGRVAPLTSQTRLKAGTGMFSTSSNLNGLKELMTIRSVALQHRAPSVTQNINREDDLSIKDPSFSRPASSTVGAFRQFPKTSTFRAAEKQFYDRMLSAKGPKRTIRLQPLQPPKTAGHVEVNNVGEVRGTRLQTAGEQLLHSITDLNQQIWGARNGMLPPLDLLGTADTSVSLLKESRVKSPKRQSRASSAISNKNIPLIRERVSSLPDSRPNTTHSFLADQSSSMLNHKPKLRDSIHSFPSKSSLHNDSFHHNMTNVSKGFQPTEGNPEYDDLMLWGHGPPLISHQHQRKQKSLGGTFR